ncbi:hypothetical protein AOQ84DRAFT_370350 [Glonium stellatum]|uniref:Uncharacterized protein n=1 Tax=Glonium stellatum TaxID=574774 RepID=A0A8E2FDZ8_9PEZI|nr:hypothetical protein AOQ84DRAFT_370350 [Glonium stellatum]
MRFFKAFPTIALLPALVFSNPEPVANPALAPVPAAHPAPAPAPEAMLMAEIYHLLDRRATDLEAHALDLSSLLGNLTGSLGSLTTLLNPAVIGAIAPLVTNANELLSPPFVNQTRELIGDVAPLVSAVAQLITSLLGSILG